MSERWVQHKSGQGEKWEVEHIEPFLWRARNDYKVVAWLPKSEYIECDPPEVWEECTREVVEIDKGGARMGQLGSKYRWAWRGDALVIERKK